jgi:site-specific DNA-adenine methylase
MMSQLSRDRALGCENTATRLTALPDLPPTVVGADAREIDPPPLDGVVVFLDPPYQGTTKYAHDLDRDAVLELARRWDRAGATVAISEQEPLTGWADRVWHVDITAARKGQKRTFSKQQREWLSMNRPPVETPAEQIDLFAGAT